MTPLAIWLAPGLILLVVVFVLCTRLVSSFAIARLTRKTPRLEALTKRFYLPPAPVVPEEEEPDPYSYFIPTVAAAPEPKPDTEILVLVNGHGYLLPKNCRFTHEDAVMYALAAGTLQPQAGEPRRRVTLWERDGRCKIRTLREEETIRLGGWNVVVTVENIDGEPEQP